MSDLFITKTNILCVKLKLENKLSRCIKKMFVPQIRRIKIRHPAGPVLSKWYCIRNFFIEFWKFLLYFRFCFWIGNRYGSYCKIDQASFNGEPWGQISRIGWKNHHAARGSLRLLLQEQNVSRRNCRNQTWKPTFGWNQNRERPRLWQYPSSIQV